MAVVASTPAPVMREGLVQVGDELLPRGLEPQELCDRWFASIAANEPDVFLACTAESTRPARGKGSFFSVDWHKGREKVRKYGVVYKFIKQGDVEVAPDDEGGEETCTVHYTPCFGPVPGYKEGATIGAVPVRGPNPHAQGPPEVVVSLVREWEEWRVASVVY